MPLLPGLTALLLALPQGSASVRVLGADGKPAVGVKVVLQVGLARFALTEDFDRWLALERKEGTTDAEGRAQFAGLPAGARLTVFARAEGSSALVEGAAGELELRLEPAGSLRGKVTGKKVVLHVDDWAGLAVAFEEAGIPTICVRAPYEIRDLVSGDQRGLRV